MAQKQEKKSIIPLVAMLGLMLSNYAIYVEHNVSQNPNFVALCDGSWYSCSKVFSSPYGHLLSYFNLVPKGSWLDQPNAVLGALNYCIFMLHPMLSALIPFSKWLYLSQSLIGLILSAYLAYVLIYILQDICLVCFATHIVNVILFYSMAKDAFASKTHMD